MKIIWLVLGIAAIGCILFFFKKTAADKISLVQIVGIKERVSFGSRKNIF
jgi:hypothetical protein